MRLRAALCSFEHFHVALFMVCPERMIEDWCRRSRACRAIWHLPMASFVPDPMEKWAVVSGISDEHYFAVVPAFALHTV